MAPSTVAEYYRIASTVHLGLLSALILRFLGHGPIAAAQFPLDECTDDWKVGP